MEHDGRGAFPRGGSKCAESLCSDARRGADTGERVGPPRMVALGRITANDSVDEALGKIVIEAGIGASILARASAQILLRMAAAMRAAPGG